jgi:hypothetical protein
VAAGQSAVGVSPALSVRQQDAGGTLLNVIWVVDADGDAVAWRPNKKGRPAGRPLNSEYLRAD